MAISLAGLAVVVMLVAILAQVGSRHILGFQAPGVVDVTSQYLMPISVLIAISVLERRDGHISVNVVMNRLPDQVSRWLHVLSALFVSGFFLALLYSSALMTLDAYERGVTTPGDVTFPLYTVMAISPIAAGLVLVQVCCRVTRLVFGDPGGRERPASAESAEAAS